MATKTPKIYKLFIHTICVFCINFPSHHIIELINKVQPGLFNTLLQQVYAPTVEYICNSTDFITGCEICLGTLKLLGDNSIINNLEIWNLLFYCLITIWNRVNVLSTGINTANTSDELLGNLLNTGLTNSDGDSLLNQEFDNAYSKLSCAIIPIPNHIIINSQIAIGLNNDVFQQICTITAQTIGTAIQQNPNKYNGIINNTLSKVESTNPFRQKVLIPFNINI